LTDDGRQLRITNYATPTPDPSLINRFEKDLVYVAPAPFLIRLERLDYGVAAAVEVFGGMFVLGVVAAAYVAALHTEAQVNPRVAYRQAILAAVRAWGNLVDLVKMFAFGLHFRSS
jgi:hypothetical protein